MTFKGFDRRTIRYLRQLKAENTKAWFEDHRDDYERYFIAPAVALIEALAPITAAFDPPLEAVAKVNEEKLVDF